MKIVILKSAQADLQELRRYILRKFSMVTWEKTYAKIKESIRNLAAFPFLGSIPEELEAIHSHRYRQLLSGMNRIIYEVAQNMVFIHMIVDEHRAMPSLLMLRLVRAGT